MDMKQTMKLHIPNTPVKLCNVEGLKDHCSNDSNQNNEAVEAVCAQPRVHRTPRRNLQSKMYVFQSMSRPLLLRAAERAACIRLRDVDSEDQSKKTKEMKPSKQITETAETSTQTQIEMLA